MLLFRQEVVSKRGVGVHYTKASERVYEIFISFCFVLHGGYLGVN